MLRLLSFFLTSFLHAKISLTIRNKPTSLHRANLEARLDGAFLIRHYELVFKNPGNRQAEGELVCPLDLGERIVDYAMDVNGTRRAGVIVPAKRAKVAYEEIVRRRVDPGIVEIDEVKNEFRARGFPIPPSGLKTIWLTTSQIV